MNFNREWRQIERTDYYVSNDGLVSHKGKILKPRPLPTGYQRVLIQGKDYYIHRLVAKAFLPNPENKPCIDHINGDRTMNVVSNIRWVTYQENMNNPITLQRLSEAMTGRERSEESIRKQAQTMRRRHGKPVIMLDKEGRYIRTFGSIKEASEETGMCASGISYAVRTKGTAGGYRWESLPKYGE